MIDETLNPSVEKSTAENSVVNSESLNVNPSGNAPAVEEAAAIGAAVAAAGEIVDSVVSESGESGASEVSVADAETGTDAAEEEMRGAVISDEELKRLSSKSLKEIVEAFRNLVENGDIMELNRQAEYIKATFYKVLKEEKIASGYHVLPGSAEYVETSEPEDGLEAVSDTEPVSEEPEAVPAKDDEEVSVNPFIEIERAFKDLYANYKARRAVYFQNLEREKQANLEKKLEVIEELKKLLESTEDINKIFPEFRALQARWREIGPVPQARIKDVYDTYQHNVENFYDLVKINNELRDLDFKKNLELKTGLCERAEALENNPNVVEAFNQLQKLHEEWKECGPVAKEFREEIWERFRLATSRINSIRLISRVLKSSRRRIWRPRRCFARRLRLWLTRR